MHREGGVVTRDEVVRAATAANAHAFVSALPEGYDTMIGDEPGCMQLSGGQKQSRCRRRNNTIIHMYIYIDRYMNQ
jgi:ABC-type protease/lipase transport system fused ATPase/permease subunit